MIDQEYYLFNKACDDKTITVDELNGFKNGLGLYTKQLKEEAVQEEQIDKTFISDLTEVIKNNVATALQSSLESKLTSSSNAKASTTINIPK